MVSGNWSAIARIEDVTMNLLIANTNEVLEKGQWTDKLNAPIQHTANALADDEVAALKEAGVHAAYNFFNEAGTGLAEHVFEIIEEQPSSAI